MELPRKAADELEVGGERRSLGAEKHRLERLKEALQVLALCILGIGILGIGILGIGTLGIGTLGIGTLCVRSGGRGGAHGAIARMDQLEETHPHFEKRLLVFRLCRLFEKHRPRLHFHLSPPEHERRERVDLFLDGRGTRRVTLPLPAHLEEELCARDELHQRRVRLKRSEASADLDDELQRRVLRPLAQERLHLDVERIDERLEP